jgi:phosphoglycolate phosphatase-like HAD superfamily hydrolase
VRAVAFDLDGTLVDNHDLIFRSFIKVCEDLVGRTYTPAEIRAMFGPNEVGIFRRLAGASAEAAFESYVRLYEQHWCDEPPPHAETTSLLTALRRTGCRSAVVTGCTEAAGAPDPSFDAGGGSGR